MPNQPDPAKRFFAMRMSRELHRKLQILAGIRGETLNETVARILENETRNIALTKEDYEKINAEIQAAFNK